MISVLYVDDEEYLLQICKIFLEKSGDFQIDTCSSACEALGKIRINAYDAIVSDYQMPDMDGIDFLKKVRSASSVIPFILFTGKGREEVVIEAINNGADFYIQKGGRPNAQFAELAHKIRQAVARRRAERSLVESEKRLSDIINFLPDATFAIDMAGKVIAWNRAMEVLTGVPASGIIGKGENEYSTSLYHKRWPLLVDIVSGRNEDISPHYKNLLRQGDTLSAETDLCPKGTPLHVLVKASPLCDRDGNVVGAIETIRDITERKQMEEALRESEEKFRSIIENMTDIYYRTDNDGRFVMVSPAAATILGYDSPQDLIGLQTADMWYYTPNDRDALVEEFRKTGFVQNRIVTIRKKDGSPFTVAANCHRYRDKNGKFLGMEGILHDISELTSARDSLAQANKKLDLLSSVTRHDTLNKLTILQSYLIFLEAKIQDPDVKNYLEKAKNAGIGIRQQIEFTKLYRGLGSHEPRWESLSSIVKSLHPSPGIACTSQAGSVEIFADPLIVKVFEILLDNTIRHGEKATAITVGLRENGEGLTVMFEDNGVGIAEGEKEKIFGRGYGKNTGFGLFLAREILGITGMTITETGVPGAGARFEIAVPKGSYRDADPAPYYK